MSVEEVRQIENGEIDVIAVIKDPVGIGGWLILIIIGYFAGIFEGLELLIRFYEYYIKGKINLFLDSSCEYYNPRIVNVIKLEVIISIIIIVASILALVLIFLRKRAYPKYAIGFILFSDLIGIGCIIFGSRSGLHIESIDIARLIVSMLCSIIWIIYFVKSKRVKNTCIE